MEPNYTFNKSKNDPDGTRSSEMGELPAGHASPKLGGYAVTKQDTSEAAGDAEMEGLPASGTESTLQRKEVAMYVPQWQVSHLERKRHLMMHIKNAALSEVSLLSKSSQGDIFTILNEVDMASIPKLLQALCHMCVGGDDIVVISVLRLLHSILQKLLFFGIPSDQSSRSSLDLGKLPDMLWHSVFTHVLNIAVTHSDESIRVKALAITLIIVGQSDHRSGRALFGSAYESVFESLHKLLQKENGFCVKKHAVDLLFLLLSCPNIFEKWRGESENKKEMKAIENVDPQEAVIARRAVIYDLLECLACDKTSSLGLELCCKVVNLLKYCATLGDDLANVRNVEGTLMEFIIDAIVSQVECKVDMFSEKHELQSRYFLMRDSVDLLNILSKNRYLKPMQEKKFCGISDIKMKWSQSALFLHLNKEDPDMERNLTLLVQSLKPILPGDPVVRETTKNNMRREDIMVIKSKDEIVRFFKEQQKSGTSCTSR